MTQQPDELFRERLENFQMPAPANAWSRIESGLGNSNRKGLWLKIAAGLVLLSVASVLIWNTGTTTQRNSLSDYQPASENKIPAEKETTSITDSNSQNTSPAMAVEKKEVRKKSIVKKSLPEQTDSNSAMQVERVKLDNTPSTAEVFVADVTVPEVVSQTEETHAGVYLVYTAEVVNEKYLRKQQTEDATSGEKKSSRIQMLMGVAYNLKNGDSGFGDLRQKKDEIFALNFLEEKKQLKKN